MYKNLFYKVQFIRKQFFFYLYVSYPSLFFIGVRLKKDNQRVHCIINFRKLSIYMGSELSLTWMYSSTWILYWKQLKEILNVE